MRHQLVLSIVVLVASGANAIAQPTDAPSSVNSASDDPRQGFTLDTQVGMGVVEKPGGRAYATVPIGIGLGLWVTPRFALRARISGADYLYVGPEAEFVLPKRFWLAASLGAYGQPYDQMTTDINGWEGGLGASFRAGFD